MAMVRAGKPELARLRAARQAAADSRARNRDHGHGHALGSLSVALPERDAR